MYFSEKFDLPNDLPVNNHKLAEAMGTFWNMVFEDKLMFDGYIRGNSEEILQNYYEFDRAINTYSKDTVQSTRLLKWFPLLLSKSKLNEEEFLFEKDGAVFGVQPEDDTVYAGQEFVFGGTKQPVSGVYTYENEYSFDNIPILASKVYFADVILTQGIDFIIDDNLFIFNSNLFERDGLTKYPVYDEGGNLVDEQIMLWCYNGEQTVTDVYDHHGYIFSVPDLGQSSYRDIIQNLYNLFTEGGKVKFIKAILSLSLGVDVIKEVQEVLEEIRVTEQETVIITDKNVYRIPTTFTVVDLKVGDNLNSGTLLIKEVAYYDNVQQSKWWRKDFTQHTIGALCLGPSFFSVTLSSPLYFRNSDFELFTVKNGNVNFPVEGNATDVSRFNSFLTENLAANMSGLLENQQEFINPLDYMLENFLQHNSAAITLTLDSSNIDSAYSILPIVRNILPAHTVGLIFINLSINSDTYDNLNSDEGYSADYAGFDDSILKAADESNFKDVYTYGFGIDITTPITTETIPCNATYTAVTIGVRDAAPTGRVFDPDLDSLATPTSKNVDHIKLGYYCGEPVFDENNEIVRDELTGEIIYDTGSVFCQYLIT